MDEYAHELLDHVQERGRYPARREATSAVRCVLQVLGSHLVGDDRTDLTDLLPRPYAAWLSDAVPAAEPLRPAGFVAAVAAGGAMSVQNAHRAVTAVLPVVGDIADDALLRRILTQLPPGHAELFGWVNGT